MALSPKTRKLWLTSTAGVLLVAGIAAAGNLLSHFVHLRLDLSRGRLYSVSSGTVRILRSLKDPVLIDVYSSRELPPQVAVHRGYLRDLLKEYASRSKGKVRPRFIEVDESPAGREEALQSGIQPVRFDIISHDRYEQREGFLGLAMRYRDKKEVLPFIEDAASLEYDLTSRIETLAAAEKPELAFATSAGGAGPEQLDPGLRAGLESRYAVRALDLAAVPDAGIPDDVRTLLIVGPRGKFAERELYLLDQYLASGRSLGVALDAGRIDTRSFVATPQDTGLPQWLSKHGITVKGGFVLDAQNQPIQVSVQQGRFALTNIVPYPAFIVVTNFDRRHPITRGLESLVLPFASPLELQARPGRTPAGALLSSSRYSWVKGASAYQNLSPFGPLSPADQDLKGPFPLAAALEDLFQPAYDKVPAGLKASNPIAKAVKPGRLVVVGASSFIQSAYRLPETNFHFFMNLADWLSLDADLIAIRSKAVSFRPLREIPAPAKAFLRYVNILVPPLSAVAAGLFQWRRRRRDRARRMKEFGAAPDPAPEEPAPLAAA